MIKKERKRTAEPIKETITVEPVVTSTSAPTFEVEVENVIPIRTPTTSQPTPTTPVQPISPQPQPQSNPRSRSTPRQQPGSSYNLFDDDLPFPNIDTMNLDFLNDPNDKKTKELESKVNKLESEAVQMEDVIASLVSENERLRKRSSDLEADKKMKDKKIDILYKVLEKKLGIDFEAEFNRIEIEEAEVRSDKRARKAAAESEVANADKGKEKVYDVPYETEKEKEDDDKEDDDKEDDDKEDDVDVDIEGSDHDGDDKGDDNDDDNLGGIGLLVYEGRLTKDNVQYEYMNDDENEEDADREGDMDGHDENSFEFDFEEELNSINIAKPDDYVFNYIPEADNYDNVVVEYDSDDEITKYSGEGTDDFPTFQEMFDEETQNLLKRKIEETTKDGVSPRLSKDEIREARKTWFKLMAKERKFRRPLAFFTRNPDVSLGDINSWG
ncbi:protein PFC0760c-like [Helianthus annuus]|uniref:protein PFC0760c-like n=1 Tax=Helianthus annuus TaxID=4232 RepID=UPI000B8F4A0F|nr:protein PFC0760c-like [Helianthus annuus]